MAKYFTKSQPLLVLIARLRFKFLSECGEEVCALEDHLRLRICFDPQECPGLRTCEINLDALTNFEAQNGIVIEMIHEVGKTALNCQYCSLEAL